MSIEENVSYLVKSFDALAIDVKTIKRGLYGDPDNKVIGLIERQDKDEIRLDALEAIDRSQNLKKKWFTGLLVVATGIIEWFAHAKDIFK